MLDTKNLPGWKLISVFLGGWAGVAWKYKQLLFVSTDVFIDTLELKNKLNLPRPRPLENLILPGGACWRLIVPHQPSLLKISSLQGRPGIRGGPDPSNRITVLGPPADWLGEDHHLSSSVLADHCSAGCLAYIKMVEVSSMWRSPEQRVSFFS